MWKSTSIFTSFILFSLAVIASNGDLEIKLINKEKKELEPGSTSNIAIMLVNNSDTEKDA